MFKKNTSILLIFIIFLTALSPSGLNAQILTNQTAGNEASQTNPESLDLRKIIAGSSSESSVRFDAKQMERESFSAAKRAKLSKGQKTGLYIGIAAAIVATVIVIIVARGSEDDDPRRNCSATCTAVGCPPPPPCP